MKTNVTKMLLEANVTLRRYASMTYQSVHVFGKPLIIFNQTYSPIFSSNDAVASNLLYKRSHFVRT